MFDSSSSERLSFETDNDSVELNVSNSKSSIWPLQEENACRTSGRVLKYQCVDNFASPETSTPFRYPDNFKNPLFDSPTCSKSEHLLQKRWLESQEKETFSPKPLRSRHNIYENLAIGSVIRNLKRLEPFDTKNINVESEHDLYFSTTITAESKLIIFTSTVPNINFGKISVYFPKFSILGERKINFEIGMPSNCKYDSTKFIFPVLYISQKKHIPFLQQVTVTMKLNEYYDATAVISNTRKDTEIEIVDDTCVIKADSFSPIAGLQETSNQMLKLVRKMIFFPVICLSFF